jgi:Na+-driven multidrug efflux pump
MIQSFLAVGSWMVFFLIIEKLGERDLAISHIVRSVYMVLIIPLFGFSQATSTLVSNVIGQGDVQHVLKLVKKSVLLSMACTSVFFPFIYFFPEEILAIYTNDLSLIAEAIPVLYVVNIAMLFFAVAYILFSAVAGTGKTFVSMMIEVTTLVFYLSTAFLIGIQFRMPLPVVWYSEFIYFGIMGGLSFLYLKFGRWTTTTI